MTEVTDFYIPCAGSHECVASRHTAWVARQRLSGHVALRGGPEPGSCYLWVRVWWLCAAGGWGGRWARPTGRCV